MSGAAENVVRVYTVRGVTVKLVVKATDPSDGATVTVVCPSKQEALAAVQILQQERFHSVGITDNRGTAVDESDLSIEAYVAPPSKCEPAWEWRAHRRQ